MKRGLILVLILVLLVIALFLVPWNKITGQAIKSYTICTETDGGDVPEIKGTVTLTSSKNTTKVYIDKCYLWKNRLNEYYCRANSVRNKRYKCDYGCRDGVCLPNQTCTDSDNGAIYNIKGTTCLDSDCKIDNCEGARIIEYYCSGNIRNLINSSCLIGCSNGRCVNTTT